ncbi:iron uptake transporter deferrochelatase/peroxidase subunit [Streptomyces microflavus]|uniref:iron uptake transporter deferrochelatase/peroxidase subunit n=1 Tax=Streptomyces TaxID=1883 RepID=UPI0005170A3B|nr:MULTISPECIES: iron uptake transporter deferrochelatase/peroxidase subunit [Streptomyces]MCX4653727.1 iron uptake transporter deferrochelatase/peroxidase subunit [Streptomyces microflavus]MDX2979439.1 iron uptake transporter deferrochelatase/peroxidase subunit [Streptomyces sp. NRRL_B-2249]WSS35349.1 iron uptake transporter deferrochelatase/peroxidase subunit [Streptomyces microflavus]WST16084.1 iron uptake transporter deferrochelatase/peroxidase subunit [Streptomyces microflavus]GGX52886.1 
MSKTRKQDPAPTGATVPPDPGPAGVSRRRLLGGVGAAGATGLVLGAGGGAAGYAATRSDAPTALTAVGSTEAMFHGKHQPGITTPLQARGHLVAFDLVAGAGRKEAVALMRRWSALVRELMAGRPAGGSADGPGHDTGIALDAGPSSLTVTFGFGRTFFARTGLTSRLPAALDPLPPFSSDQLDAKRSDGDLWVQIGADDALVAFHALRAVQKESAGTVKVRWQMNGFNRTPGATARPMTARNLMGQIDGTGNPKPADEDFDRRIFVPASPGTPQEWLEGGSYAVVRRIRMLLDDWEKLPVDRQEQVIGRRKADGAPLSGGSETTAMDLDKAGPDGRLVIPDNAHARISSPEKNGGAAMLRRPFSYHDGISEDGTPDAGLLFVCWQADPFQGFVPVQRKLDRGDALSPFIRHEASGLFAVPGGAAEGEYVGQRLLES